MTRFLVVGGSILDVIVEPSGRTRKMPGGSPANVAVGLGRLGHDVALWTHLGTDEVGIALCEHLTGSGVGLPAPIAGVTSTARAASMWRCRRSRSPWSTPSGPATPSCPGCSTPSGTGACSAPRHAHGWGVDGSVVRDVLSHAALVAAITVTRAGAAPPTRAELRAHG